MKKNIIVSCTTTKNRLDMLFYMIESIKKQEVMPDILYVNISTENYLSDEGISEIPAWLKQDFIYINKTENIGPYRKLLPVIQTATADNIIITADDDILYGPRWLKSLVELAEKYPEHIVCARAREMKKNFLGRWQNYERWSLVPSAKQGLSILPTNGAGTVFRKDLLDLTFLLDPTFKKIAPTTDDLWFRMATLRKNVPVFVCPEIDRENIYLEHNVGLKMINFNISDNYYQKVFRHTIGIFQDWLGLNTTENDYSWSRIVAYSKATPFLS